jgi:hypothetical protein
MNYTIKKDPIDSLDILVKTNEEGRQFFIPFDPDNTDYQAYLKWVEAGNTPEPADEQGA